MKSNKNVSNYGYGEIIPRSPNLQTTPLQNNIWNDYFLSLGPDRDWRL